MPTKRKGPAQVQRGVGSTSVAQAKGEASGNAQVCHKNVTEKRHAPWARCSRGAQLMWERRPVRAACQGPVTLRTPMAEPVGLPASPALHLGLVVSSVCRRHMVCDSVYLSPEMCLRG